MGRASHLLQKSPHQGSRAVCALPCPPEGNGSCLKLSCSARQEGVNSISQCHMSKRLPLSGKLLSLTVLQIRELFRVIFPLFPFILCFYTSAFFSCDGNGWGSPTHGSQQPLWRSTHALPVQLCRRQHAGPVGVAHAGAQLAALPRPGAGSQVSCPPALAACCGQRMLSALALCMPITVNSPLQRLSADMLLRRTVWATTAPGVACRRAGKLEMGAALCYC